MSDLFILYDRWHGLITLLLGICFSLVAFGYLPRKPRDPERLQVWRNKFGRMMKVLAPCLVLGGLAQLAFSFTSEPVNPAARRVFDEFHQANKNRLAHNGTLESVDLFLIELKRIETGRAPEELRKALSDYITALDDGLKMLRLSQTTADADARMADAKHRLEMLEARFAR